MRALIARAEVIVVVGGRHSNNTRQLVFAAEAAGRRAHQIERAGGIGRGVVRRACGAWALTAGTSTLPETVRAVRARLEEIAAVSGFVKR